MPLNFEPNVGQEDDAVKFLSRGPSYTIFLMQDEVVLGFRPSRLLTKVSRTATSSRAIHLKFLDSDRTSKILGTRELSGKVNYFLRNDPTKWKTNVSTYSEVSYTSVYPGIDLVFYGSGKKMEYDFVVKPGADPNEIRLAVDGADSVAIDKDGALLLSIGADTVSFKQPLIYQPSDRGNQTIIGSYLLEQPRSDGDKTTVSFKLGVYDRGKPLVIDPVLDYSTYLGGSDYDWASGVAVNASGEAYVVGTTSSVDFPTTPGSIQPDPSVCLGGYCRDIFVTKFNATGTALVYSTYIGGSYDDYGTAIALDPSGSAYITGNTQSTDFPTTGGALQRSCAGSCRDVVVAKLSPNGSLLAYSTYLGGGDEDDAAGISVRNGNAYVSGYSQSTDFPVTPGAFQSQMQGQGSSFVAELNANATALNYATFIGEVDLFGAGPGIAVDSMGNSYLAGVTLSANFPFTSNAFHTAFFDGTNNTYITKLNSTGSALAYSALLGGAAIYEITIDNSGAAYIAGSAGPFYPITAGAMDPSCGNGNLVAKLSPDGSTLNSSALVCAESFDRTAITRDQAGNVFLFGDTDSTAMPTTVGAFQTSINNQCCFSTAFLTKVTPDFSALGYATYFGGSSGAFGRGVATDSAGNVYGVGSTSSTDFPVRNAFQPTSGGSEDVFLSKFSVPNNAVSIYPSMLNFNQSGLNISSLPLTVTLANVSNSPLSITSISSTGDFSQTNTCGVKVVPFGHCTVKVIFAPKKVGTRNGNLIMTNGRGKQIVKLTGTGVNGPVLVSSSSYQINNQPFGYTSPPLKILVSNSGNKNLEISEIYLKNGPAWDGFGKSNCLSPLKPHGTCILQVDFTPDDNCFSYGDTATLEFLDNANDSPQVFGLFGRCGYSAVAFSSYGVRFSQIPVGNKSINKSVTLINGQSSPLTINSIAARGDFVETNNCPTTLKPGAYCYFKLTFVPTQGGILQGSVTVIDSANNSYILPLLGTGVAK
jgi:hypothetical protein